jgi:hypothetical protein
LKLASARRIMATDMETPPVRTLVFALIFLAAAPVAGRAGIDANLITPREANAYDLGCERGDLRGSKFPTQYYDEATHERIMYNISRCTGGFIMAPASTPGKAGMRTSSPAAR